MAYEMVSLLRMLIDRDGSDLHLAVDDPPVGRVHGHLQYFGESPLTAEDTERLMKSIASVDNQQELQEVGGADFGFAFEDVARFRVSIFKQRGYVGLVLRQIPRKIMTFEELGLPVSLKEVITQPRGMILVTGPTGSGKTTTLYSALSTIKSDESNIMTCEDPIEYELDGINQSAVNVRAGLTFAAQLRAILRQDPDIILVGEIRDRETADIAFQAAMTGHLVFSTLHCNDAPSAITRLVDMGVEPYLIGSSVIGVLAQRLVRTLCPRCKSPYIPTLEELTLLGLEHMEGQAQFYRASGCSTCNMRGYSGRIAVFELMPVTEDLRRLAINKPTADQVKSLALEAGMRTMRDHAAEKVLAGLTSIDEIRRKVFVSDDA